jgi:hypothetical protein
VKKKSRVFLSHDIDSIHGSFFQDGMWAMKKGRLDILFLLVFREIAGRPGWKNMDAILSLHESHGLKSTFFWLATNKKGPNGVKNADYQISKLSTVLGKTKNNGLHKSCYPFSFREELEMLPFKTTWNRYHFLKFSLPDAWQDLESAGIMLDASLGFAEQFGFRNNYGLPFRPYNLQTGKPHSFVEVPLTVMDGTFQKYMKVPASDTGNRIIKFLEKHRENCVLSVLWHNTFFSEFKYGGYLKEYQKVLLYLKESGMDSINPGEIISEYCNGKEN